MSGEVQPRHRHLASYHERVRQQAMTELAPLLDEAARIRATGATWEETAQQCRELGFTGRSGAPISGPALYLAARKYRPGL